MRRIHAIPIALALAAAVVTGAFAALRTTQLGAGSTPRLTNAEFARQSRALDHAQEVLRAELARKPAVKKQTTVVFQRSTPIVRVVHRRGAENEAEGGGGELDD